MTSDEGFVLYPFQDDDVEKILKQRAGAIGSEMGTGKTHEAIAIDEEWWKKGAPPTLVIAPLNTHEQWQEKYALQSPAADVTLIDRKNRGLFTEDIRKRRGDVFIMHYEALRLMPELAGLQFNTIIADEVHRAANRKAVQTRALKKLHTNHKLAMSGTMSGDAPQNLWSILNWLWPEFYRSYWSFVKHYLVTETQYPQGYQKIVGVKNVDSLKEQMSPWFVRHLKKEACCDNHPEGVMSWLPEKQYDILWVDLTPTQRRVYEEMRKNMVAWVNEHEDSPLVAQVVIAQMTRLSQMALATPTIDETTGRVLLDAPSSKIDAVKELILDAGQKQFAVWTSSKQAAYLAAKEFEASGISSRVLSGDTKQHDRRPMVNGFVGGDYQVFVGVIQAGGEGVDGLQHATDTAIFLDRAWSTIRNQQAEDRTHRDGTKDGAYVIDVLARNTLDWGRKQRLDTKWSWIKQILGDKTYETQRGIAQTYKEED
jgi:SNF2 family DNA or RNA helicase